MTTTLPTGDTAPAAATTAGAAAGEVIGPQTPTTSDPDRASEPAVLPPARRPGAVALVGWTLCVLAVASLGFVGWLVAVTDVQQARSQETLYDTFRGQLRDAVVPVVPPIDPGIPVAVLEIPQLGIRQVVVEGTAGGQLAVGPGHRRDTVLPGQAGVSVIAGRRATFGAPFRDLPTLVPGDEVRVVTGQGEARYTVLSVRDARDPVPPSGPANRLNLVTSDPALAPDHGIIVTTTLRTEPQPIGGRPVAIGPAERNLARDPGAALPLALWSQLLVATVATATWAYVRWGRWQAYVASTPVVLAVLWNVYENLARLLPNTL